MHDALDPEVGRTRISDFPLVLPAKIAEISRPGGISPGKGWHDFRLGECPFMPSDGIFYSLRRFRVFILQIPIARAINIMRPIFEIYGDRLLEIIFTYGVNLSILQGVQGRQRAVRSRRSYSDDEKHV